MSYTLQQYNPLSHLGQLLYQDSVAERDARLQRGTEVARQQAATDAYARNIQADALAAPLRWRALTDAGSVAEGTPLEPIFKSKVGQMIAPGARPGEGADPDPDQSSYYKAVQQMAQMANVPVDVVVLAASGDPVAKQAVQAGIEVSKTAAQTESTEQIKQVRKAEADITQNQQRAAMSLVEMDRALQLLETVNTGGLSIQGLANLPTDSAVLRMLQAQMRSPEGETLKRLLANRFGEIRRSAFGDRLFATEVPAALDLVPDLLDRPEVIKAAIDTISLSARYDMIAASLYQQLQAKYRAGQLLDESGRPRRISMADIQQVYQTAADALLLDVEAVESIQQINQALGS